MEQSTVKSSKMRASTRRWERILSFMRGERARVTLPPPPSPTFCSVNVDRSCCFTICGGLTPADVRPIEVVGGGGEGRERGGRGEGGEGERRGDEERGRGEGRRSNIITHSDSEKDMSVVLVPDPDQLMRSGNEASRQYVPFCWNAFGLMLNIATRKEA